ncbi:hypothetical protein [Aliagarivorans marinus]|uniref:hypothetical protein n=1 Tax=Aliagarivorans marinus TaxID=561965 RepID=UPI000479EAF7|nr:hypothetical protein [Aliagarivorans marinus]
MKSLRNALLILLLPSVANADFLISISDGDYTDSYCASTYSFSNNLESLHREQQALVSGSDIYSTEETLTNKIWMGKPVYRKVLVAGDLSSFTNNNNTWRYYDFDMPYIDTLVDGRFILGGHVVLENYHLSNSYRLAHRINKEQAAFKVTNEAKRFLEDVTIILEYTKQDVQATANEQETEVVINNELVSYIHFTESATKQYQTIVTDNKSVKVEDGYYYSQSTGMCEQR